jgi:hypothetical protein
MARYYFDVSYDATELRDQDGLEIEDPRDLEKHATEAAAEIVRDVVNDKTARDVKIEVLNGERSPVLIAQATVKVTKPD